MSYQYLSEIDHILTKPAMYVGDPTSRSEVHRISVNGMIVEDVINYSAGLERLFLEILHNAIDNAIISRREGIDPGIIEVSVSRDTIRIANGGKPITLALQTFSDDRGVHTLPAPSMIFGQLRTSGNFDTNRDVKDTAGTHGFGAKLANIFSSFFRVECFNGSERASLCQTWTRNMQDASPPIIRPYEGPSGTVITFTPDLHRFGFAEIDDGLMALFHRHCIDASMTSNSLVSFNGVFVDEVPCTFDRYLSKCFHSPDRLLWMSERVNIALIDEPGRTLCYTNGVYNQSGGTHFEKVKKHLINQIRNGMKAKPEIMKEMTPSKIARAISLVLVCRVDNAIAIGQTKEKITAINFNEELPTLSSDEINAIYRWSGMKALIDRIMIDVGRVNVPKPKRGKIPVVDNLQDAEHAGTRRSGECTLIISEGNGANNVAMKSARVGFTGTLPLRGKFPNVSKISAADYAKSQQVINLINTLGLEEGRDYSQSTAGLRYGRLEIMTDQDDDGIHIRMLILNFFKEKFPSLFNIDFIYVVETPYIKLMPKGFDPIYLYSAKEYDEFLNLYPHMKNVPVKKFKGLGTYEDEDILAFRKNHVKFSPILNEEGEAFMIMAFHPKEEQRRKDWIMSWNAKLQRSNWPVQHDQKEMIAHMVAHPLCGYSVKSVRRAIPSIIDGFKESQRKAFFVISDMKKETKCSNAIGIITAKTYYEHGDKSMEDTIARMASRSIYNNIPPITGIGQFNNRTQSQSAAPARYVSVKASELMKYIIRKEDDIILTPIKYAGEVDIEPETYFPIIPLWLVNGTSGVATGFATKIPMYNPKDVIMLLRNWIKYGPFDFRLVPYYKTFKGSYILDSDGKMWFRGVAHVEPSIRKKGKLDIVISELPANKKISSYTKFLDTISRDRVSKDVIIERGIDNYSNSPAHESVGDKYIEIIPNIRLINADEFIMPDGSIDMKALRLETKIETANLVFVGPNGEPTIYPTMRAALETFYSIRLKKYEERIAKNIEILEDQRHQLSEKLRFINDVVSGNVQLTNNGRPKTKSEIDAIFAEKGYDQKFKRISIAVSSDDVLEVQNKLADCIRQIDDLKKTNAFELYDRELAELETHLE